MSVVSKAALVNQIMKGEHMTVPQIFKSYAEELGFPESGILFKIFNILYDGEDDIKLLSAMPGNAETISQTTGIPIGNVQTKLEHLCGNCTAACPTGALVLAEFRPIEHIRTSAKVGNLGQDQTSFKDR